jgi:DNA-binding NtrC family response regulator
MDKKFSNILYLLKLNEITGAGTVSAKNSDRLIFLESGMISILRCSIMKMKNEKPTILIVDDEEVVLDVEGLMLEKMGFNILKANSSEKACRLYRNKKDDIDLVILDMIMPDDNGAETYKKLKIIDPTVKVLISSGFWKDMNVRTILKDGKNSFIQKPFRYTDFNKKVNSILAA